MTEEQKTFIDIISCSIESCGETDSVRIKSTEPIFDSSRTI